MGIRIGTMGENLPKIGSSVIPNILAPNLIIPMVPKKKSTSRRLKVTVSEISRKVIIRPYTSSPRKNLANCEPIRKGTIYEQVI
jgi:hypothetical protein